jgi:hypothetical protein
LARTREATHNSWDKSDPKDAQVILHLLKAGLTQRYHDPRVHSVNDIQDLSKTHHRVSLEKRARSCWQAIQHRLFHRSDRFPGSTAMRKNPSPFSSARSKGNRM